MRKQMANLPPVKIAFIIDNEVVDVLHTEHRLGAILLSEPLIMDFANPDGTLIANVGDIYNPITKTFSPPKEF